MGGCESGRGGRKKKECPRKDVKTGRSSKKTREKKGLAGNYSGRDKEGVETGRGSRSQSGGGRGKGDIFREEAVRLFSNRGIYKTRDRKKKT